MNWGSPAFVTVVRVPLLSCTCMCILCPLLFGCGCLTLRRTRTALMFSSSAVFVIEACSTANMPGVILPKSLSCQGPQCVPTPSSSKGPPKRYCTSAPTPRPSCTPTPSTTQEQPKQSCPLKPTATLHLAPKATTYGNPYVCVPRRPVTYAPLPPNSLPGHLRKARSSIPASPSRTCMARPKPGASMKRKTAQPAAPSEGSRWHGE